MIESFRDMTYIMVAILVLSHYRLQDFKKYWFLYVEWLVFSIVGGSLFVWKGEAVAMFPSDRIVLAVNLLLWGIILIQTVVGIFLEKRPLDFICKPFAIVWLLMMVGMCILRKDIYWPEAYLIVYGTFYLTDYSEEERELLFQGMLNGILLGFFLLQGWCFVFRPYDILRYSGVYSNANHNVVFYLIVLAAIFTKLLYAYRSYDSKEKTSKLSVIFLRVAVRIWYWFLSGALLGFIVLTIGRTGYLVSVILVFIASLMRWRVAAKQWYMVISSLFKSLVMIMLCFCLMFPVVFAAVRYIPPVFHHPVWFWGEWNEDRVQSWQPWDSENYIEFDDLLKMIKRRVGQIMEIPEVSCVKGGYLLVSADASTMAKEILNKPSNVSELQWQRYQEMLAEGYAIDLPEYWELDNKRSIVIRYNIYRYYIYHLNWKGHPTNDQGFQILPNYWVGHAHNIYLQWGTDFGISVMVLFFVLVLWTIGYLVRSFHVTRDPQYAGYLLFFLVPCLFGMLEFCWGAGSLPIALMFFVWGRVMCRTECKEQ